MIASQSYDPLHYGVLSSDAFSLYHSFPNPSRKIGPQQQIMHRLGNKPVLCIFSDAEGLVLVSDLHQTHAANDNQCCQSNKRINCDAVEHGFQSGFLEVGKAGIQTDGSQCSDH